VSQLILTTKLFIPPLREDQLSRQRLVQKLNESIKYPFSLVSAAGGYGKTTALSEWVAQIEFSAAWLSLDSGDNDPALFLTYLISALQTIQKNCGENALEILRSAQTVPFETILINLLNELAEIPEDLIIILDDYHVITDQKINELVPFLIDRLPPQIHLIIASRIDPPWPLARYRARNQLIEIRSQDLRFNVDETAEFLNRMMGLQLSGEDVDALEERTEGWVAGLQLVALSMHGRSNIHEFVEAFTGSNLYVAEYLIEEILKRQSDEIQSFLLQTSLLERLNAGLCKAVTGCPDGQSILSDLHRTNVFVIPLDNEGLWFRYHHLFADLLNARLRQSLSPEAISSLHLRAVEWYEDNGFVFDAVNHAFAAKDLEKAASLLDHAGQAMIFTDRYTILEHWLDALPNEYFDAHPRLEIYQVLIELSMGKLDMFEQTLLEKENLIRSLPPSPENDRLRLEALVYLSAFMAHQNTSRAIQMAQDALMEIDEEDLRLKASLFSTLYRAYGMEGDIGKSAPAYKESLRLALATGMYGFMSNVTMVRAFDLCQYGKLDEATRYCQIVIDSIVQSKSKALYPAGPSYIGLGGIHLERNELEKAEQYLEKGLELCQQGALYGLYTGYIQNARLLLAKGEFDQAVNTLNKMEQSIHRMDFTLTAQQVASRLAIGDVESVTNLVAPLLEILGKSYYAQKLPLIAAEAFKLSLTRIFVAQGKLEEALQLLDEIQATVEPMKRFGRLMEVNLLRARICQKQEEDFISSDAICYLVQALELAKPAGFVTLFLEEGPTLIPLLKAVLNHQSAPDEVKQYVHKLLDAFGESITFPPTGEIAGLVELLTPREMEVLRLLAKGDSNQIIAEKLVITVRTVKKHTGNIYGKLNANGRIQAVTRARELGLLSID